MNRTPPPVAFSQTSAVFIAVWPRYPATSSDRSTSTRWPFFEEAERGGRSPRPSAPPSSSRYPGSRRRRGAASRRGCFIPAATCRFCLDLEHGHLLVDLPLDAVQPDHGVPARRAAPRRDFSGSGRLLRLGRALVRPGFRHSTPRRVDSTPVGTGRRVARRGVMSRRVLRPGSGSGSGSASLSQSGCPATADAGAATPGSAGRLERTQRGVVVRPVRGRAWAGAGVEAGRPGEPPGRSPLRASCEAERSATTFSATRGVAWPPSVAAASTTSATSASAYSRRTRARERAGALTRVGGSCPATCRARRRGRRLNASLAALTVVTGRLGAGSRWAQSWAARYMGPCTRFRGHRRGREVDPLAGGRREASTPRSAGDGRQLVEGDPERGRLVGHQAVPSRVAGISGEGPGSATGAPLTVSSVVIGGHRGQSESHRVRRSPPPAARAELLLEEPAVDDERLGVGSRHTASNTLSIVRAEQVELGR